MTEQPSGAAPDSPRTSASLPTRKDIYSQGSSFCQQYSKDVMALRTFAQHVLLGYVVAMGLAASKLGDSVSGPPYYLPWLLAAAGSILCLFALVLWILNQHYSCAFRRIRDDVLVPIEEESAGMEAGSWARLVHGGGDLPPGGPPGPWAAHMLERVTRRIGPFPVSGLAWQMPFLAMLLVGVGSLIGGVVLFASQ